MLPISDRGGLGSRATGIGEAVPLSRLAAVVFGPILAIDRSGFAEELRAAGASLVVHDPAELLDGV
jgi:hypothetical protein